MRTTRVRIVLRDVAPTAERVVDVPADVTLPERHDPLQAAMGWTDSHLHQFATPSAVYGVPLEDDWDDQRDEAGVRMRDLPEAFVHRYELGDGWEHDITVPGSGGDRPRACRGFRRLPSGGLRRTARLRAAAPGSCRPTPPGAGADARLGRGAPRLRSRRRRCARPADRRPAAVEEDLPPLAVLHDLLRRVGLLRLRNGVLSPTRAAADDTDTVRRLRSSFAPRTFDAALTDLTVADLAARGPRTADDLAATLHPSSDPAGSEPTTSRCPTRTSA